MSRTCIHMYSHANDVHWRANDMHSHVFTSQWLVFTCICMSWHVNHAYTCVFMCIHMSIACQWALLRSIEVYWCQWPELTWIHGYSHVLTCVPVSMTYTERWVLICQSYVFTHIDVSMMCISMSCLDIFSYVYPTYYLWDRVAHLNPPINIAYGISQAHPIYHIFHMAGLPNNIAHYI